MSKRSHVSIAAVCSLLAIGLFGCNNTDRTSTPTIPPRAEKPTAKQAASPPSTTSSETAVEDALTQCFASAGIKGSHSAIPPGTRLLSVKVDNGVAALDVSKEFNSLANSGESSESHAQKELRRVLAEFPTIRKMSLTVEGKPFDSQATDWSTPFPVRDSDIPNHTASDPESERSSR